MIRHSNLKTARSKWPVWPICLHRCLLIACIASAPNCVPTDSDDGGATGFVIRPQYVDYQSLDEAKADANRRKRDFLYSVLSRFWNKRARMSLPERGQYESIPSWTSNENAKRAVLCMSALLKVLSDPRPFQNSTGGYSDYPIVDEITNEFGSEYNAFIHFRNTIATYLKTIKPVDGIGTLKDYDMVLVPLIGMLYGLKDVRFYDHSALGLNAQQSLAITNEMAFDILCHDSDACHNDNRPYFSFKTGRQFLTAFVDLWYQPETENHVLNALTWSFLATQ